VVTVVSRSLDHKDKTMPRFLLKHWKKVLWILIAACLIAGFIYRNELLEYLKGDAQKVYQNYIVEIIAGLIFAVVPALLGIHFGKKLKELEFYNNLKGLLNTIAMLRRSELIEPLTARHLVQSIARNFGSEAIKQQWIERAAEEIAQQEIKDTQECRICSLEARVEKNRCKYCKLNCYAWDLSSLSQEEKENLDIDRIKKQSQANQVG
jgi:hypothetical protein